MPDLLRWLCVKVCILQDYDHEPQGRRYLIYIYIGSQTHRDKMVVGGVHCFCVFTVVIYFIYFHYVHSRDHNCIAVNSSYFLDASCLLYDVCMPCFGGYALHS